MEKIYTIDDIYNLYKIEITEVNKIKSKKLFNFEEDELLKERKKIFQKNILEVKKIEVEVINVFKTKKSVVLNWTYDINSNKKIVFKLEDSDLFLVTYNSERVKDYCFRYNYFFPQLKLESFYYNNPNFKVGQKIIFDVKYYSFGFESIIFYNNIDKQFLEYNFDEQFLNNNNSNCFVVTTTMGDINHPVVIDYRRYRDEVLLNTYFGSRFIRLYYRVGPILSKVIKNNKFLFLISKKMILKIHNLIK
jgi:hypothetical protein